MCTVVWLMLMQAFATQGFLGEVLYLEFDNTVGENKCKTVIGFAGLLIELGLITRVHIFCKPKGHTFTLLDQSFSKLIRLLSQLAIWSINNLVRVMYSLMRTSPLYNCQGVEELNGLFDFTKMLHAHMYPLDGYATGQDCSGMHEFILTCDDDGRAHVRMRKSSQSTGTFPEAGEGYRLFTWDSPPLTSPPTASVKSDAQWDRAQVTSTVRQWYHHF